MAKRCAFLERLRIQPVVVAVMTLTVVCDVNNVVLAFLAAPAASMNRIHSVTLLEPRNLVDHEYLSSAASSGFLSLSRSKLNSAGNDDGQDSVLLDNENVDGGNEEGTTDALLPNEKIDALLGLLGSVPSNLPTPKSLTEEILDAVRSLEEDCPTPEASVLSEVAGNWELLWTAQDRSSDQYRKGGLANRFINPLENQSYSNNPFQGRNLLGFRSSDNDAAAAGRANPVLPRGIQDALENAGILEASGGTQSAPVRSSQAIDLRKQRVRNVVTVKIQKPFSVRGSLIVDVGFKPNGDDPRKVDVKFESCRLIVQNANIDQKFPLGIIGPTGWLRTGYIDDNIRITRGHKGSVFILSRTAKRKQ